MCLQFVKVYKGQVLCNIVGRKPFNRLNKVKSYYNVLLKLPWNCQHVVKCLQHCRIQ